MKQTFCISPEYHLVTLEMLIGHALPFFVVTERNSRIYTISTNLTR